ncbi:tRNA uridine-5-carboxymethylaminomethyl(34) synthesis GTPase MnmE [Pelagibacteraceae bacterium]|jgi:tRNA modification GTPase|nr:tRNA uridine-5-carboxymethylaminomethyl(34) synthesis GTPase MnmE [Pelagibacteraceae bacterium]MDC0339817.1 tRNA uridine-5-carboxymethylaminomethyl(34) synthesis GTPase MnmE [Pelagibacteraceae bacterium]MDC0366364.1 tRNA uridine-5-carboxymethylaminomethyl(34) synthesis GTPase MnmE [Pelagibacteraceae bacterium]
MNIYALSSGRGPCGIAIIRISGKDAFQVCKNLTQLKELKSNEVNYCKFYDPKSNNIIDPEALLLWFPAPNSYTGDDLAEFHVHGSNAVISSLLKILSVQDNCRLAEPGEFTKIAFQNDKMDLLKAESIADLIHSETELQRQQAAKLVQGNASNYYNDLREKLIKALSYIEAKIDFAEGDLPEKILKEVHKSIKDIHRDIQQILENNKVGEKIRDGFKVSIIGEVNAGKSSLLNLLSKREVAIVSEEEGTTRDVIETFLNIDGYPVILADTAGIREAKNEVEKKGISLALGKSKESDLNIIMIDNSSKVVNHKIKDLINEDSIVLLNKSDIKDNQNHKFDADTILVSVRENKNIDIFIKKLKKKLSNKFTLNNSILITRERHRAKLNECLKEIDNFLNKDQNKDIELAAEDLRMATRHLGSIVGKVDVEEILGSIFKDFCIGK